MCQVEALALRPRVFPDHNDARGFLASDLMGPAHSCNYAASRLMHRCAARVDRALVLLGPVRIENVSWISPLWHGLLNALQEVVPVEWVAPSGADHTWFRGTVKQLIGQTILRGATSFPAPIRASAPFEYVQAQLTRTDTLARQSFESQQALNQAENDAASARADAAEAQANYDAAVAGPTREERAIADAQVQAAAAAVVVIEHRLEKMILLAPADGVVSVIAAEVGENVRAGRADPNGRGWQASNGSRSMCAKTISVVLRWEKR